MIKYIIHNEKTLAIIIKRDYCKDGIEFFTPNEFSQQLAQMGYKKGKVIDAHVHNSVKREVYFTKEVLIVKKGKLRVDFYTEEKVYIKSNILDDGDVILLAYGGHGFEVLEDCEVVEVKQGPYVEEQDKVRFKGISASQAIISDAEDDNV